MMIWYDKLNVLTTDDIRWKISKIEDKIKEINKEIAGLTNHRDLLKKELKKEKQKIDTVTKNHITGHPI
jgi:peptidoglycan hydrolase CwlO-like protein